MLGKRDAVHSGAAMAFVAVAIVGLTIVSTLGLMGYFQVPNGPWAMNFGSLNMLDEPFLKHQTWGLLRVCVYGDVYFTEYIAIHRKFQWGIAGDSTSHVGFTNKHRVGVWCHIYTMDTFEIIWIYTMIV